MRHQEELYRVRAPASNRNAQAEASAFSDQRRNDPIPSRNEWPSIGGMRFTPVSESDAVRSIIELAGRDTPALIVTANLDHLRRYKREPAYRDIADTAALVLADGMPIVWAASIRGTPLPGRVAGSSIMRPICAAAARAGRSVFFLGGNPGVAAHAADLLRHESPDLRIAGVACPPPGFERDEAELDRLLQDLRQARPEIVLVALGSPKQEFIARRLSESVPPAAWIGVGISFSFITGDVLRAPRWMQRLGLEWVHRLAQEPRRLFQRYILQGVPFASRLLLESLRNRAPAERPPSAGASKQ